MGRSEVGGEIKHRVGSSRSSWGPLLKRLYFVVKPSRGDVGPVMGWCVEIPQGLRSCDDK